MRRRSFILAPFGALFLAPGHAYAQQPPAKVPRIGVLSLAERTSTKVFDGFREGLHEFGYVEGDNITIEYRLAAGDFGRLPAMAADLVRLPVNVIITDGGDRVTQIAHGATRTIPIVMATSGDPVANGLAASFPHPGGNVTGFTLHPGGLFGKWLQLLKEVFPAASRIAALWNPPTNERFLRTTEEAARSLGVQLGFVKIGGPDGIAGGFEAAIAGGAEAVVIIPSAMFWNHRAQIIALAADHRMPAIYPEREYADDGGLLRRQCSRQFPTHGGVHRQDPQRRQARRSADPATGEVRTHRQSEDRAQAQPTIPPAILDLADEVIE